MNLPFLRERVAAEFGLAERASWTERLGDAVAAMTARHEQPAEQLLARIDRDRDLMRELAGGLTVEESYFQRDPAQIKLAAAAIGDKLAAGAAGGVSVLSAGCARGEEAYSVAIERCEQGDDDASLVEIMACDISYEAVARARSGIYSPWSLRETPTSLRDRYFEWCPGGTYRLKASLRSRVTFFHRSIAEHLATLADACVDVILFRNVAIHLDPAAVRLTMRSFARVLRPSGLLLVAPTDPIDPRDGDFVHDEATAVAGVLRPRLAPPEPVRKLRSGKSKAAATAVLPSSSPTPSPTAAGAAPPSPPMSVTPRADAGADEADREQLLRRGHVHLCCAQLTEAVAAFRCVVYLDADDKIGRFWYATALRRAGEAAKAARQSAELERQLQALPGHQLLEDGVTTARELLAAVAGMGGVRA